MAADNAPMLFGEYRYGMAKDAVAAIAGPCQETQPLVFRAPRPVGWLGQEWQETFSFNSLNELQEVALSQAGKDAADCMAVQKALIGAGWQPAFLETDGAALDALKETRLKGADEAARERDAFEEKALRNGGTLTVSFLPEAFAKRIMKSARTKTYDQALDNGPENTVVAALTAYEGNLSLTFRAPLLSRRNALRYGQVIRRA